MDADYVIVGGGCAGLSLAVNLLQHGPAGATILIVEPRSDYVRDRTWCYHRTEHHAFAQCVTHRYSSWRVRKPGASLVRVCERHPYEHIPADLFYDLSLKVLKTSGRAEVQLGTRVERIDDRGSSVVVGTSAGELRAPLVFDSRPATAGGRDAVSLSQHFVGWSVRTERPAFDPATPTLMDFAVPQQPGIHFVYVLPYSAHEALVEDTFITPPLPSPPAYDDHLAAYLDGLGAGAFEIVGREHGALPMSTGHFERRPSPRVVRIGLAGGLAKPSSGYAFLAIQRQSRALAAQCKVAPIPVLPRPRSARRLFLDRVFVSHLARHPERAVDLFFGMFERVPPDALARFLSETSSPKDDLLVMGALPPGPLVRETLRSRRQWLRPT